MKKQLKILIFQHSTGSPAGTTLDFLTKNKINYDIFFWGQDKSPLDLNIYTGLIILGGPQNVDEEKIYPWLIEEKQLIKNFISSDKPVLGLCLGGQLIAEVLGAKVYKSPHWEVGWHNVDFIKIESPNSIIPDLGQRFPVFQWHGYRFDLPKECELIARNNITPHQAFVFKNNVVATQFHPESTKEWITSLFKEVDQPKGQFVYTEAKTLAEMHNLPLLTKWHFEILENLFLN